MLIFQVVISVSISIGFKLLLIIPLVLDIIENAGVMTSLPSFLFKLLTAISKAAVPLETQHANFLLTSLESFSSKSNIFDPAE